MIVELAFDLPQIDRVGRTVHAKRGDLWPVELRHLLGDVTCVEFGRRATFAIATASTQVDKCKEEGEFVGSGSTT